MSYFIYQPMHPNGIPSGRPVKCMHRTGVILQCPGFVKASEIDRMCSMAQTAPEHPYDLVQMDGPEDAEFVKWNARVWWIEKPEPQNDTLRKLAGLAA